LSQGSTLTETSTGGVLSNFKSFFLRGLAALLPTLVTIAILLWAYDFVNRNIGQYITRSIVWVFDAAGVPPPFIDLSDALVYGQRIGSFGEATGEAFTREFKILSDPNAPADQKLWVKWQIAAVKYHLGIVGFVLAILLIWFVGVFLASFMGRTVWRSAESLLVRIPVVGTIYPNVKQVTDFLLSEKKFEFSHVVAVQYPRKGIWSVALVTGSGVKPVDAAAGEELIVVFVPSSPTPVTGYTIIVPRRDVVELPWSIDEALRFTISGGVICPSKAVPMSPGRPRALLEGQEDPAEASERD